VLAAGCLSTAALRRAPADARHLVWLVTVAALLALPCSRAGRRCRSTPCRPAARRARPRAPGAGSRTGRRQRRPARVVDAHRAVAARARRAVPRLAQRVAASGSAPSWRSSSGSVPSLMLLARLAVGLLACAGWMRGRAAARRRRLAAGPLRRGGPAGPRGRASARLQRGHGRSVRERLWRGTIVLPATPTEWSGERRRLVLFHELAHLKRRDLASHLLARVACARTGSTRSPGSPPGACARERACLRRPGALVRRAAEHVRVHLLEILTSARAAGAPQAAVAMARRAEFEGRMLAILDPAARGACWTRSFDRARGRLAAALPVRRRAGADAGGSRAERVPVRPRVRDAGRRGAGDERPRPCSRRARSRRREGRARAAARLTEHERAQERHASGTATRRDDETDDDKAAKPTRRRARAARDASCRRTPTRPCAARPPGRSRTGATARAPALAQRAHVRRRRGRARDGGLGARGLVRETR
jgi:hypothetical protein